MKNLNYYKGNTTDFFEKVVKSKRNSNKDPNYTFRVNSLKSAILGKYAIYDHLFRQNSLITSSPIGYLGQAKDDLHRLYDYSCNPIQELLLELTTIQGNRKNNLCQNCTIDSVSSFDHVLPQGEFVEFIVNPKNLFPCCTTCNKIKNEYWRKNGKLLFLNLYLDILPTSQYLFVTLNSNLEPNFYLKASSDIPTKLFELIESHYNRLHLFSRFLGESGKIIEKIENLILAYKDSSLSKSEIVSIIENKIIRDKISFGNNFWESILEDALIHNNTFIDNLFK